MTSMSRLELVWTDATKMAVATCRIVKPIDVVGDVQGCNVRSPLFFPVGNPEGRASAGMRGC